MKIAYFSLFNYFPIFFCSIIFASRLIEIYLTLIYDVCVLEGTKSTLQMYQSFLQSVLKKGYNLQRGWIHYIFSLCEIS